MTTFSLYPSPVIARKREVFALRAEFSSLSFPKEKGTKKKGNLRACALKNPPDCTDLLCSIKSVMFPVFAITGRALYGEITQSGKSQKTISSSNRTVYVLTKFKFFVQYRQKYLTYGSESITISKYGNSDEFAVFRAYCMNFMCLYCSLHIICTRPVRFCEGQLYFLSFRKSSFDCGVFGRFFPFIMNE